MSGKSAKANGFEAPNRISPAVSHAIEPIGKLITLIPEPDIRPVEEGLF